MTDLDAKIRDALKAEDADLFGDEPGLPAMVAESFRSKNRWLVWVVWVSIFIFTGIAGWTAYGFFTAETIDAKMEWGLIVALAMLSVVMLEQWYWMELQKNTVVREVKRVELQIARLAGRLDSIGAPDRPTD